MTHREAAELVEKFGGEATSHVSRQTTLLVVGEEGWPLEADGKPSQKFQHVQQLRTQGASIRVLRESDWLQVLDLSDRRGEVHRLYTPAMLGQMLHMPVALIRRWERAGLIRAAKRVCRLPYFDFQEVARLQRLAELLEAGISRSELEHSLIALADLFPEAGGPRAKLHLLARDSRVFLRDDHGLVEPASGQRVFSFGEEDTGTDNSSDIPASLPISSAPPKTVPSVSAAEWFSRGCELLEDNDASAAVEAFRMSLILRPQDAETQFCLADALYRSNNPSAALERYYAVVETDRKYLEAWTQIGCLHSEREELDAAIAAFRIALELHADYPDAHFHLAEALQAAGKGDEAMAHWQRYLEFDRRGPWADIARQRLGLVEQGIDHGE